MILEEGNGRQTPLRSHLYTFAVDQSGRTCASQALRKRRIPETGSELEVGFKPTSVSRSGAVDPPCTGFYHATEG